MFCEQDIYTDSYGRYTNKNLSILLGMYKGNYYRFAISTLFFIIKHSPAWLMPIVIANIVNSVIDGSGDLLRIVTVNISLVSVLIVINVPMNYLHFHFSSKAIREVESGLRAAIIRKLHRLSITYHNKTEAGRLQSKVMRDVEAIQTLSQQLFVSLLNLLINISVAMIITAARNIVVFLFFLMAIPLASFIIVIFRRRISQQNKVFRMEMEATSAKVMEMEEMISLTRAHGLEKLEVNRMQRMIKNIADEGYKLDIIQANFGAVSWGIFQLFQITCLVFTVWLVVRGSIKPGDIILYQSYFTTIVTQVSALIMLLPIIAKGLESVASIGEVLNVGDVEENEGKLILEDIEGAFEFKGFHYKYPDSVEMVLSDINMKIAHGETVAFVGSSGSGKSTTINLLIGFALATKGTLTVDGYDMSSINRRTYRDHIAVVPQNTILFAGSIRDNITYGMDNVTEYQVMEAIEVANLKSVIEALPDGLDTMVGERGNRLSGGQKQRISIARAVIRDPKVILFDEATSALDSVSEKMILTALDNLTKGRTTFMVAHRLSTVRKADRICVMESGRIIESGSYEELVDKKGFFYNLMMT